MRRLLITISLIFFSTGIQAQTAMDALKGLTSVRIINNTPTEQVGWMSSDVVATAQKAQYTFAKRLSPELISNIATQIKNSKRIYISSYFLGNAEIIEAIAHSKRVNNALVICILENKVNANKYITPDYLSQNGAFIFYPDKLTRLSGTIIILDNIAYILPTLDIKDGVSAIAAVSTDARTLQETYLQFVQLLNLSEISDYTKMRNPNAIRIINEKIK